MAIIESREKKEKQIGKNQSNPRMKALHLMNSISISKNQLDLREHFSDNDFFNDAPEEDLSSESEYHLGSAKEVEVASDDYGTMAMTRAMTMTMARTRTQTRTMTNDQSKGPFINSVRRTLGIFEPPTTRLFACVRFGF
jgi:hypothetical protein